MYNQAPEGFESIFMAIKRETITGLRNKNRELRRQMQVDQEAHDVDKKSWEEKGKQKDEAHKQETDALNSKIKELQNEIQQKQEQLNQKELKKLAQAYGDQEGEYRLSSNRWLSLVVISFIALSTSVALSAYISQGKVWHEKLEFYLINFVTITLLIFSLRHFSVFVRLRTDFANRKTLAQAYHNILTSTDDEPIKQKFIDKTTDRLCAPSDTQHESYTVPEKILDSLAEIAKNLSKK